VPSVSATFSFRINTQNINFQGASIKQNQYLVRRLAIAAMRQIVSVVAWSVCLSVCLSVCSTLLVTSVRPAKTDKPIEMQFGRRTRARNPSNSVLDGARIRQGNGQFSGDGAYWDISGRYSQPDSPGGSSNNAAYRQHYRGCFL